MRKLTWAGIGTGVAVVLVVAVWVYLASLDGFNDLLANFAPPK